jgi:hypothetical protein
MEQLVHKKISLFRKAYYHCPRCHGRCGKYARATTEGYAIIFCNICKIVWKWDLLKDWERLDATPEEQDTLGEYE